MDTRLLDPAEIAAIASLEMRARLLVEGYLAGRHRSRQRGTSVEFVEHRPYRPGDDPSRIDWKAYGRTDRLLLREYEAEQNLQVRLLLDASSSMVWSGEGRITKHTYGLTLAAGLALLLLRRGDAVGAARFDTLSHDLLPVSRRPSQFGALLGSLSTIPASRRVETDLAASLSSFAERCSRRDLVILFSDLLDDPQRLAYGLGALRARKAEVLVIQILDPIELRGFVEDEESGGLLIEDAETGRRIDVDAETLREQGGERARQFVAEVRTICHERRVAHRLVTTDQPFVQAMRQVLERPVGG